MKTRIINKIANRLNHTIVWNVENDKLYIKGMDGQESEIYESDLNLNFNLALNIGLSKVGNLVKSCPLIEV